MNTANACPSCRDQQAVPGTKHLLSQPLKPFRHFGLSAIAGNTSSSLLTYQSRQDATGHLGGLVRPPATVRQRSDFSRQNAAPAFCWLWRALAALLVVFLMVAFAPAEAATLVAGSDSISLLIILAGGVLAAIVFIALATGVSALLRRTRRAANEARRLQKLLDVLDEGVAVCTGMQAVAVNSSL